MQTLQGALRQSMPNIDKILRQQRFDQAVARGQKVVARMDTIAGKDPAGAILLLKQNRYDCAAYLAVSKQRELSARRKRPVFIPARASANGQGLSGEKLVDELVQCLEELDAAQAPITLGIVELRA